MRGCRRGNVRGSSMSVFSGGRRAKSLLANASLHWSHARAGSPVLPKQVKNGVERFGTSPKPWTDKLVEEAAASEDGAAVGAKIGSGSGTRSRGFAAEILVVAKKAHKESAVMSLGIKIGFRDDVRLSILCNQITRSTTRPSHRSGERSQFYS